MCQNNEENKTSSPLYTLDTLKITNFSLMCRFLSVLHQNAKQATEAF